MDLNVILGPIVLAVVANAALYGTCVIQWYSYFTSGYKDPWHTRLLVFWVVILDTFHTGSTIYMLWEFTVPNFGNPNIFADVPWPFPTTPIFIVLASVPIQHFLAWRIKGLCHSWAVFAVISVLSLAQGACGFAGGVLAIVSSDPASFKKLLGLADSWVSIAVFTDVLITGCLLLFLSRSKTGFKKTDSIIARLIRTAIETSAFGALFCIVDVIAFTTKPETNLHFFFALPQARIYTNTLMMTLNSRISLRKEMNSTNANSFNVSSDIGRFKHTEVSVAVSQDIQLDKMSESEPDYTSDKPRFRDDRKIATVA